MYTEEREHMIESQLRRRGIKDPRVISAMYQIPRHLFVSKSQWDEAYHDHPLPIACGQTISQPYMVAVMTEMLQVQPTHRVLEIGTGSGYQTAILAKLAAEVITIERYEQLTKEAAQRLKDLGITNVQVVVGDGTLGFSSRAPYDRILVTAGAPKIPPALADQLAINGRLVAPIGRADIQFLVAITRRKDYFEWQHGLSCRFVPLLGEQGWQVNGDNSN